LGIKSEDRDNSVGRGEFGLRRKEGRKERGKEGSDVVQEVGRQINSHRKESAHVRWKVI
jgi:hypothetical protein